MPLASVQEWRARIGSSWCALGRVFKTGKSPGDLYHFHAMSGRAMLQAMYVLNALIFAYFTVQGIKIVNGCATECSRQLKSKLNMQLANIMHAPQINFPCTAQYCVYPYFLSDAGLSLMWFINPQK